MSITLTADDRMGPYIGTFSYFGLLAVANEKEDNKAAWLGMSVGNLLGYIPGVSLIVGIARIIFSQIHSMCTGLEGMSNKKMIEAKALQEAQLVRGVMECASVLAPLLLIADLSVSIFFGIMMFVEE